MSTPNTSLLTTAPLDPKALAALDSAADRRILRLRLTDGPPQLSPLAFYGVAGRIVTATAPTTEASPAAMLGTLLTVCGAMMGRGSYVMVGPERHHPRLFSLVVGATAKARKGTSLQAVMPVLRVADAEVPSFMSSRKAAGVGSGEGLVAAVSRAGAAGDGHAQSDDSTDGRLLAIESEFTGVLVSAQRQGSKLSQFIRDAWDGEDLQVITKSDPLTATEPHICLLGHTTIEELRQTLTSGDMSSGFGNRFLYLHSHRAQLLDEPAGLPEDLVQEFGGQLQRAILRARTAGELPRSDSFRAVWRRLYRVIEGSPSAGSMFDSLTVRTTPYLLRLSLIFALLDEADALEVAHLRAALAVAEYSAATVAFIWRTQLGDAKADKLLAAIRQAGPDGLNRTAVNSLFGRNGTAEDQDRVVRILVNAGLAEVRKQTGRPGRPAEFLVARQ